MLLINIAGRVINFPSSAQSPNWSEAVIQFALAVEAALLGVVGPFDISPQSFSLDPYNSASNVDIIGLTFPPSDVRAANIRYTVHRETDSDELDESGLIMIVYNDTNGSWDKTQTRNTSAQITFDIANTGQFSFSTTSLAGSNHTGFITFAAQSLLNE